MQSFLKYGWEKLALSIPACLIAFTQDQIDILWVMLYIIVLDTILGIWVAIKYKIFTSHHLSRVFEKIARYGFAMATAWALVAAHTFAFGWLFDWMGVFIILTEAFSNFEKLALLGFSVPGKILARLNRQFVAFIDSDIKEEKGEIAIDIMKNRPSPDCSLNMETLDKIKKLL